MADPLTPQQRHRCMSHIRAKNTKPEVMVRRWLWSEGYRYRLYVKSLPGCPDIVMRKYKIAIFVNGCFWHGHRVDATADHDLVNSKCCKVPRTNHDFWVQKIKRNIERDTINYTLLKRAGWRVLVVWECQLKDKVTRTQTLRALSYRVAELILEAYGRQPVTYADTSLPTPMAADEEADYLLHK
ncbi:MAG: DNA mismatch endonuclease Vsr [Bacteroidaceae bacterium]|nr:DNA mismatch endonuclease Vsr [Bacteroidaceae bacterium]